MAELTRLCGTSELAENEVKAVSVGELTLAVYNIEGEFFVTDDRCTHGAASLAEGVLEDGVIECALHGGGFNVRTGEVVYRPCVIALRTYKVVIDDDDICVDLEKSAGD